LKKLQRRIARFNEQHQEKSTRTEQAERKRVRKINHVPKLASASGKDQVSLLEVSKMTAEFTLPNRSVRSTRESPTKEIMTSRCPTILTANPASIAIGGGISSTIQKTAHTDTQSSFSSSSSSQPLSFRCKFPQSPIPKTLATSPTTSPPFLLPLSLTLGFLPANPYYVSDRSSILPPPAFYTPGGPPPRPATNRKDFMNTFISNFFLKKYSIAC